MAETRQYGEVGEGGAFYQWYVSHELVEEAKKQKKGVGHASQIIDMQTGEVWLFDFFKQSWGDQPFGGN